LSLAVRARVVTASPTTGLVPAVCASFALAYSHFETRGFACVAGISPRLFKSNPGRSVMRHGHS